MNAPAPSSSTRWLAVGVAIGCGVLGAVHLGKVPPALPQLRAAFGLDLPAAGWLSSSFSLGGALLGAIAGTLAERWGRIRVMAAGLAALGLASLAGAGSTGTEPLLLARAVESAGFLAVTVTVPGIIVLAAAERDRRLALGLWGTYMPAGVALAMALAPPLLAALGWQGLWLALGALALAAVPVLLVATRGLVAPAGPMIGTGDLAAVMRRPGPWLLGFAFGTYSLQWFGLVTWLPSFMIETLGLAARDAGLLTALVVFANVLGNVAGGILMDRGAPRWAMVAIAQGSMAVAMLAMQLAPIPDLARYGAALAFSGIGGLLPAAVLSGAPRHALDPRRIGVVNGLMLQGANLGTVSGPPLLALLVATMGSWQVASPLLAGAALIGIGAALGLRQVERR